MRVFYFPSLQSLESSALLGIFQLQPPFREMNATEDVAATFKSLGSAEVGALELIFAGIPARALREG